jgi:hypothetical protein
MVALELPEIKKSSAPPNDSSNCHRNDAPGDTYNACTTATTLIEQHHTHQSTLVRTHSSITAL